MCADKIDVLYTSRINKYHLNCRAIWGRFPFAFIATISRSQQFVLASSIRFY